MRNNKIHLVSLTLILVSLAVNGLFSVAEAEEFSPYVGEQYPRQVLWGDTHLHTSLSMDARAFGATLDVEDAYRFARGETVQTSRGLKARLSRPLDFLVVADHSDALGVMNALIEGNEHLMGDDRARNWQQRIIQGGTSAFNATMEVITSITNGTVPAVFSDGKISAEVWQDYVSTADRYNQPGRFTAMIGYEWTSTPGGNNLHRNVLYRDGAELAGKMAPFTVTESDNPEDLWAWMQGYEDKTGGKVLALAHNGNLSNGLMFPEVNPEAVKRIDKDYAAQRARWEPLYEVTQIKGDGETHSFLSPNDEFADFETWDKSNLGPVAKKDAMLQYEYAREALKNGLKLERELGANPYKFGLVGSTDSHTGLVTAAEDNFFGKHSGLEPDGGRTQRQVGHFGDIHIMGWEMAASGYAAVWANENTRAGIFDAMQRKEVYATTGSRITVRFFGGWHYAESDAQRPDLVRIGYTGGVPMGGDLPRDKEHQSRKGVAPRFLVSALKDPLGANLDRIQIIKGWVDAKGETQEKVFDVTVSDNKRWQRDGRVTPVGNTVDEATASYLNSIGSAQLNAWWQDPEFDPRLSAFYYVRILEIPTPRWTSYDAVRFGTERPKQAPASIQERAYTSPIWYQPESN